MPQSLRKTKATIRSLEDDDMAFRSIASSRGAWAALAVAGALAGTAGEAAAQYIDDYGGGYRRSHGYDYDYGYRRAYREVPPARIVSGIAVRDFGMSRIERTVRTGSSYVVDGAASDGARLRLIFDARSGILVDRIVLQRPDRPPAPRVARVDPRDDDRPAPRIIPRPPERPASLKPPAQASAPATVVPVAPAIPPAPTPGPVNPSSGQPKPELARPELAKPGLVNPRDVRGTGEAERAPPLARAEPPAITIPPVELPPVQIEDIPAPKPGPQTPAVPVAPLD
jgi:hypothetical protein